MNDLMTIKTNELTNKKLASRLNSVKKHMETIGRNKWKVADELRAIYEDELYKDDFSNDTELAEALGMKRQNFQKLVKASKYHSEATDTMLDDNGEEVKVKLLDGFTVSAVFEMLSIKIEDLPTFFDTMNDTSLAVDKNSTVKQVREAVQTYKAWIETDNEPTDNEPTDNEPTDNEPTDNELTDNEPTDNETSDNEPILSCVEIAASITDFINANIGNEKEISRLYEFVKMLQAEQES